MRVAALSVTILFSNAALAQTIADCGASSGKAFYFDQPDAQGWMDDGISSGVIALVKDGANVDILVKDRIGTISARSQGATVTLLDVVDPFITVLVDYPGGSKELYTFDTKRRVVAWTQHKFGVMFDKVQAMVAQCK
jgi:hypothetical protein